MKCCMHYHSMGIIKIYFGKSQENLKNCSSRDSKLQQEGLPLTDLFFRMALLNKIHQIYKEFVCVSYDTINNKNTILIVF